MRLPALLVVAALSGVAALVGCDTLQAPQADPAAIRGPDDPRNLQPIFERVVAAARAKQADAIVAELERFLLTRQELEVLFGPEVGAAVWPGYSDAVAGTLRAEAAATIIERVADGYTEVRVDRVGPAYPARTTPGDQRMLEAFVPRGLAMYSVWIRKPGETLGLRFNGFVYHDERWRALLKAYDHLPAEETPAEETPAEETPAEETPAEETPEAPGDAADARPTAPEEAPPEAPAAPPGAVRPDPARPSD